MTLGTSRVERSEKGSALIIALAFLALLGLFVTATLTSAESGLHVSQAVRIQPKPLYGADAAIEQTIQTIRSRGVNGPDHNAGAEGDDCHTQSTYNGRPFYVSCTGQPGSGATIGGGSSPNLGILTLATGAEVGYQQGSNAIVRLDGGLYSNSGISFGGNACGHNNLNNCSQLNLCANNQRVAVGNISTAGSSKRFTRTSGATFVTGSQGDTDGVVRGAGIPIGTTISNVIDANTIQLSSSPANATGVAITFREYPLYQGLCSPPSYTKGKLTALGTCPTGNVVAVQTNCPFGVADPAVGSDPEYSPDATVFVPRVAPPCGAGPTVEFQPGLYTSAEDLTALTNGSCPYLLHFNSGTYNFNFTGSSKVWTISNKDVSVSAGEKTWDKIAYDGSFGGNVLGSNGISSASLTPSDVGKYVNSGTNFPFGNQILSVNMATSPPTAITSSPALGNNTSGNTRFVIGQVQATCLESNSKKPVQLASTANLALSSISTLPVIDGFQVQSGDRILAKDQTNPAQNGIYVAGLGTWARAADMDSSSEFRNSTVVVQNGVANGGAVFQETATVVNMGSDPVTFVPGGDHPGAQFIFSNQSRLAITSGRLEVCAPATGTNQQIAIYGPKTNNGGLLGQTGCLVQAVTQNGSCALITTSGAQSMMLIHGTIYAPSASLNLALTNIGYQVVNRGIIARVVQLALTPSGIYTDPVIFSPDFGSVLPADRDVVLRACAGTTNCAAGTEKIRAIVHFDDSDPSCNPDYCPGFGVRVTSWRVLR